jgi:predicted aldo/keto reductase-like oxidoreductase
VPHAVKEIWDEAPIKRTPAEWALRWVWNHPGVTVVLSGMNEEEHVLENLRIADQAYPDSLTEAELHLVQKVEKKYRELMKVGCTGCRYCTPCPAGVNIPLCFEEYNNLYMADDPDGEKFLYAARLGGAVALGEPEFASLCVRCGQCVEQCPQHIDIPAVLESVAAELEGPDFEQRVAMAKQIFKQT